MASFDDHTVSRIDPATNHVTRTVSVRGAPTGLAVGENGVWVTGSLEGTGWLTEIDPGTGRARRSVRLDYSDPIAVAAGAGAVWIAAYDGLDNAAIRIEPRTGASLATIPLEARPWDIAADDTGAWVTTSPALVSGVPPSSTLERIDGTARDASTTQLGDPFLGGVGVEVHRTNVWIFTNFFVSPGGVFGRIDQATGQLVFSVRNDLQMVDFEATDESLWFTTAEPGTLRSVDPETGRITKTIGLRELSAAPDAGNIIGYDLAVGDGSPWVTTDS